MTVTIGRRELLAALGGAAAAWPFAAGAQHSTEVARIGFLGLAPAAAVGRIVLWRENYRGATLDFYNSICQKRKSAI